MPPVFGYKCQECGQGIVQEKIYSQYRTKVDGRPFVVPEAYVGVCDSCGAEHFSMLEVERWERLFEEEEAWRFLKSEDIQELRQSLGLTMEQFAFLIGCTRQSVYNWARLDRKRAQSRMADLMMRLVRESLESGPVDVIAFLRQQAGESGVELVCGERPGSEPGGTVWKMRPAVLPVGDVIKDTDSSTDADLELVAADGRPVGRLHYDPATASLDMLVGEPSVPYRFDAEVRFADGAVETAMGVKVQNYRLRLISPTRHRIEDVREVVVSPRSSKSPGSAAP